MRVVVTRAPGQAEPLASRIAELGHEVVLCPLIRIDRIGGGPVELSAYDWVVVTSAERRRGADGPRARASRRDSPPSGRGRPPRLRARASWRTSCPPCRLRRACWPSCHARPAACSLPPRRVPARSSSTSSARTSCRSTGPPSCVPRLRPAMSSSSPRPPPPVPSAPLGAAHPRGLDRAADDGRRPRGGHPRDRGGAAARSRRARRCGR